MKAETVEPNTLLTEEDLWLFNGGRHFRLYDKLGSHEGVLADGTSGTYFSVWAPDAERVSLIGDWNGWQANVDPLVRLGTSGVWSAFLPGVGAGARYKYRMESRFADYQADKADPFAFFAQVPPEQASIVTGLDYDWQDGEWMAGRKAHNALDAPISIYELHLGSWRRLVPEEGGEPRMMTYRELAPALADYVTEMGFTHVELLPVMEHPFYGSWGYQVTGFFAASSRYGTPQDLMFLIDTLHQRGIGVLLDWVPSHFPTDEFALGYFDGTYLYEHADPRQGFHPDWGSLIFNYGRHEVQSFLVSSALFWLDLYHADGLRVDAVASMLYRDYSREEGDWVPNVHGGRENLEAIDFLNTLNGEIAARFPDTLCVAEESTAWPRVTRPIEEGGLGFDLKWDMGWMHDTLKYFAFDPLARSHHHGLLTFRAMYAGSENFVLPLSHDEVVHMKGSLIGKMSGDLWQRFANLRLLFAYMLAQPGKKLLFMGGELGQWREWNHDASLDWHLLDDPQHAGLHAFVRDANHLYLDEPALYELDADPAEGFEWLDCSDAVHSVIAILRKPADPEGEPVAIVLNFTPVARENYPVGLPAGGVWREILNSDSTLYGGTGAGNPEGVQAREEPLGTWDWSARLTLPPLVAIVLRRDLVIEPIRAALAVVEEEPEEEELVPIAAICGW
ncbi:MAG TPA: 1,4-alpha-glucan branching protein GlgB [Thermoanaerobaculia bacterium]|jgi:1,4-alpha-glucan branching enzyme|nr:1,4-alpha-glucan branching protein GlgB [Thermoanaerobaculia bacterium]